MSQQVPDTTNTPIEDKNLSVDDIAKLFAEDSTDELEVLDLDEKPAKKEEKDDEKVETKPEDKTLEDEIEEELEDEEVKPEDEVELIAPIRRKEILAKYPELFKDFPALQTAMYREKAYSELLPTIEDAKSAVSKAELLDSYGEEIMSGSTKSLLTTIKDEDRDAFTKIVDNYLPTLAEVDEGAYYHVVGNVIKHTVMALVQEGRDSQNDDMTRAAEVIYEYVFGTKKFNPPTRLSREETADNKAEDKISEREQQFAENQFNTVLGDISKRIDNTIESTVDKSIDPNQSMTDFVRRAASKDVVGKLEGLIQQDKRFMGLYDRLWKAAINDEYSTESMDRIKSAYLSKAKTLLPNLIRNARNEALKGLNRKANDDKDRKGPLPVGKTRGAAPSTNSGKTDNRSTSIPKGMTTLEFLNAD